MASMRCWARTEKWRNLGIEQCASTNLDMFLNFCLLNVALILPDHSDEHSIAQFALEMPLFLEFLSSN